MKTLRTGVVVGICCAWSAVLLVQLWLLGSIERSGQFGDMFGSANALFSGLAFAAIYASLRAQHKENIEQQRHFTKQTQLTALTAYADITRTLWIRNSDRQLREPSEEHSRAEGQRYVEMMRARAALERILEEGHVLGPAE
jgi:hypothetical protein